MAQVVTPGHKPLNPNTASQPQIAGGEQKIIFMNSFSGK